MSEDIPYEDYLQVRQDYVRLANLCDRDLPTTVLTVLTPALWEKEGAERKMWLMTYWTARRDELQEEVERRNQSDTPSTSYDAW